MKIAKADLVPTDANLLGAYGCFADLADACDEIKQRILQLRREAAHGTR